MELNNLEEQQDIDSQEAIATSLENTITGAEAQAARVAKRQQIQERLRRRQQDEQRQKTYGIVWYRSGEVAIELQEGETALARPCVIKNGEDYDMYFSYKIPEIGYRIGLAKSPDGISWERTNECVLDVSDSGWDSEMIQYSYVFEHKDIKYMLYNGNNYGESGIGYAIKK